MRAAERRSSAGSAPTKSKLVTEREQAARKAAFLVLGTASCCTARPRQVGDRLRCVARWQWRPRSRSSSSPRFLGRGRGDRRAARAGGRQPAAGHVPDRGRVRPRGDADRRRRQHLHRLRRRRRHAQCRARASRGPGSGARAARSLRPHRLHDRPVRALRRARRAARAARPDLRPAEGGVLQRGHGGGRERGQIRPRLHGASGRRRLRRARSTAARCSR